MAGRSRILIVGLAAATMVLVATAPALADPATPTNYRSQIMFVEGPGVVEVEIVGGDAFVRLVAEPGLTLEVLGYEGEEYIRFDPDGSVYVNQRSPVEADAGAIPRWETVSTDGTYSWHDHRTHWMSPTPPAAVLESDGGRTVQIFDWTLPLRTDGAEGKIVGTLTWIPSTTALPWFALSIATLVAVAAASTRLSARSQAVLLLTLAAAALLVGIASMAAQPPEGRTYGLDLLGPPVIVALGILALTQARRSSRAATQIVLIGSVGLVVWGVMRVGVLIHPILPTVLPYALDRLISAVVLGSAMGLAAGIATSITLENRARRISEDGHHAT